MSVGIQRHVNAQAAVRAVQMDTHSMMTHLFVDVNVLAHVLVVTPATIKRAHVNILAGTAQKLQMHLTVQITLYAGMERKQPLMTLVLNVLELMQNRPIYLAVRDGIR